MKQYYMSQIKIAVINGDYKKAKLLIFLMNNFLNKGDV